MRLIYMRLHRYKFCVSWCALKSWVFGDDLSAISDIFVVTPFPVFLLQFPPALQRLTGSAFLCSPSHAARQVGRFLRRSSAPACRPQHLIPPLHTHLHKHLSCCFVILPSGTQMLLCGDEAAAGRLFSSTHDAVFLSGWEWTWSKLHFDSSSPNFEGPNC